jgi:hypothetical protein
MNRRSFLDVIIKTIVGVTAVCLSDVKDNAAVSTVKQESVSDKAEVNVGNDELPEYHNTWIADESVLQERGENQFYTHIDFYPYFDA